MNAVPATNGWSLPARRGLAWLCCALMLFGPALPAPLAAGQPPVLSLANGDPEESVPSQDDDDAEGGQVPAPAVAGRPRRQGERTLAVSCSWLVHLPHHHCGQSGYALPACTPFERGTNPPLRC